MNKTENQSQSTINFIDWAYLAGPLYMKTHIHAKE